MVRIPRGGERVSKSSDFSDSADYFDLIASKVSKAIQAAEYAYNTRTSLTQTFAVFITDYEYNDNNGALYSTYSAYTYTSPTSSEIEADSDCWTFF